MKSKKLTLLQTLIANSEKARSYDFSIPKDAITRPITCKGMIIKKPNPDKKDYYFNM